MAEDRQVFSLKVVRKIIKAKIDAAALRKDALANLESLTAEEEEELDDGVNTVEEYMLLDAVETGHPAGLQHVFNTLPKAAIIAYEKHLNDLKTEQGIEDRKAGKATTAAAAKKPVNPKVLATLQLGKLRQL